jgi:hypothetical protein
MFEKSLLLLVVVITIGAKGDKRIDDSQLRLIEVVRYGEQQSSALRAVCRSMLLAKQLNRTLAEPGIIHSQLWQTRSTSQWRNEVKSTLYFGDVYNFNEICARLNVSCLRRSSRDALSRREQVLLQCSAAKRGAHVELGFGVERCGRVHVDRFNRTMCVPPWIAGKPIKASQFCWQSLEQVSEALHVDADADVMLFDWLHKAVLPRAAAKDSFNADQFCKRLAFDYSEHLFELCDRYLHARRFGRYVAMQLRTQKTARRDFGQNRDAATAHRLADATLHAVVKWFDDGANFDARHDHIFIAADTFNATTLDYHDNGNERVGKKIYKAMVGRLVSTLAERHGRERVITSERAHADIHAISSEPGFRNDAPLLSRIVDHILCFRATTFLSVREFDIGRYHETIVEKRKRDNQVVTII